MLILGGLLQIKVFGKVAKYITVITKAISAIQRASVGLAAVARCLNEDRQTWAVWESLGHKADTDAGGNGCATVSAEDESFHAKAEEAVKKASQLAVYAHKSCTGIWLLMRDILFSTSIVYKSPAEVGEKDTAPEYRNGDGVCSTGTQRRFQWAFDVTTPEDLKEIKFDRVCLAFKKAVGPAEETEGQSDGKLERTDSSKKEVGFGLLHCCGTDDVCLIDNATATLKLGGIVAVVGELAHNGRSEGLTFDRGVIPKMICGRLGASDGDVKVPPNLRTMLIDEEHSRLLDDTVEGNLLFAHKDAESLRRGEGEPVHPTLRAVCEAAGMDPYLIENMRTHLVGTLGRAISPRDRAVIAIASALLADVDVIMIHEIDRMHEKKQRAHLFKCLNERWIETRGIEVDGARRATRTVIVTCCESRVPLQTKRRICIGAGEDKTQIVITEEVEETHKVNTSLPELRLTNSLPADEVEEFIE